MRYILSDWGKDRLLFIIMNLFEEFTTIIKDLEFHRIRYALIGAVAVAFYTEPRFTRDIDLLIDSDDYDKAKQVFEGNGYFESASPWTFRKIPMTLHRFLKARDEDEMIIDLLLAESEEGKKIIRGALKAESKKGTVRIAGRNDLIWLKRIRDSKQDQADIERLTRDPD